MQNSDDDNPNDDEKNSFYDSQVLLLGKDNKNISHAMKSTASKKNETL